MPVYAQMNASSDRQGMPEPMMPLLSTFVGEYERALAESDGPRNVLQDVKPPSGAAFESASPEPALDAICREAQKVRVVILNEDHVDPRHRVFTARVLRRLKLLGYRYFAAEGFPSTDPQYLANSYPSVARGDYTIEPMFANLFREAKRQGYKLFAYEVSEQPSGNLWESMQKREQIQGENLAKLLRGEPDAKLVVHCGHTHVVENSLRTSNGEIQTMAAWVKQTIGEEVLTIDQTQNSPRSREDVESPEYRFAASKGWLRQPTVFRKGEGYVVTGFWKGHVDMQVFHPITRIVGGRPDWLRIGGIRKQADLGALKFDHSRDLLLQAFYKGDPADAVPADQFVIQKKQAPKSFFLMPGTYMVKSQDATGKTLVLGTITVS